MRREAEVRDSAGRRRWLRWNVDGSFGGVGVLVAVRAVKVGRGVVVRRSVLKAEGGRGV